MNNIVLEQTERTKVKRLPARASYDREALNAIVDEALICHVGFAVEGQPFVIPTIHWRDGDTLYFHGSAASRMLRSLRDGVDACVTVTLLDGLVLARSAFHHSMNYRSAVMFGKAREVSDPVEKRRALDLLVEHVVAGRSAAVRPPSENEMRGTLVLALPIQEASVKTRTGPPLDDEEDYALPIWAGVIPLVMTPQPPVADPRSASGVEVPAYAVEYRR